MTAQAREVYKCSVCGIVAEVLDGGAGELVCCGRPMVRMAEDAAGATADPSMHIPVAEPVAGGLRVSVGAEPHPSEPGHHIQWIEAEVGDIVYRKVLRPGEPAEAPFQPRPAPGSPACRALCNRHGLWKGATP